MYENMHHPGNTRICRLHCAIISHRDSGEMAERTNAPVSKTGMGATPSWVRIPLSPP